MITKTHHWRIHTWTTNLHKHNARIELIPRICIMYGPLKVLHISWLCWSKDIEFLKVRGTRKEFKVRVKEDVAMWREHFPKELNK